ncbi:hypothetical protein NDU88_002523 [Pleurodeles waltl]|uniref:Uncharacterized protein n=1 Tax=Pleurodeles waltl TaxID=8319 RepID=A0AAV7VF53_PLEWA|nr:hypothetical protein NDU88_002523 [Pleurodeles waltl]
MVESPAGPHFSPVAQESVPPVPDPAQAPHDDPRFPALPTPGADPRLPAFPTPGADPAAFLNAIFTIFNKAMVPRVLWHSPWALRLHTSRLSSCLFIRLRMLV